MICLRLPARTQRFEMTDAKQKHQNRSPLIIMSVLNLMRKQKYTQIHTRDEHVEDGLDNCPTPKRGGTVKS